MSRLDVIELSGGPRTRGEQYGEAARAKIQQAIGFYSEAFVASTKVSWPEVTERAKLWMPLVEEFAPDVAGRFTGR